MCKVFSHFRCDHFLQAWFIQLSWCIFHPHFFSLKPLPQHHPNCKVFSNRLCILPNDFTQLLILLQARFQLLRPNIQKVPRPLLIFSLARPTKKRCQFLREEEPSPISTHLWRLTSHKLRVPPPPVPPHSLPFPLTSEDKSESVKVERGEIQW